MNTNNTIKYSTIVIILLLISLSLYFVLREPSHSEWVLMNGIGPKCLDVEGGKVVEGARIIGFDCHAGVNQRFDITMKGGVIKVGGLCLDASNASFDNGAELILWRCHGGTNQNWIYDQTKNRLLNYYEKCVDLEGGATFWQNRQRAFLWDCNNLPNQKWYFSQAVLAKRIKGGKVIDNKTQLEIKPSSSIYAKSTGVLYDKFDNPILPSKENINTVEREATIIAIQNERVLVPVSKIK